MLERVFAVASVLFVAQTNAFTPALRQPLRLRTQPLDAIPTQELIVPVGGAPDVLGSLPSLVVAGAGELGNSQVLGYFAFLSVLIAVPFVGGTMDTFRISEFREKRQDFIDAIEGEVAALEEKGSPESLATSKELKLKLQEVYDEIKLDEIKDEENKYLGFNKYWLQMRGVTAASDLERNALKSKNADGSDRFPDFVPGEVNDSPKGNRDQRRMAAKVKKVRKPKISNSNP